MSSSNSKASKASSKRLLFDRRYGWVVDDWKDPSEEALAGGRGMFCLVPLAKGLINNASQTINLAALTAAKVLETPELLQPQALQASLRDPLHKITMFMQNPHFNFFAINGETELQSVVPSELHTGSGERCCD